MVAPSREFGAGALHEPRSWSEEDSVPSLRTRAEGALPFRTALGSVPQKFRWRQPVPAPVRLEKVRNWVAEIAREFSETFFAADCCFLGSAFHVVLRNMFTLSFYCDRLELKK